MIDLILQTATNYGGTATGEMSGFDPNMLSGASIGIFITVILAILAFYIYISFAYMKIGKKAGLKNPGVAWLPFGGIIATIYESASAHWWPFLAAVIGYSLGYVLSILSFSIGSIATIFAGIVIAGTGLFAGVVFTIWHWKTYESVGRPGWWSLVPVIGWILGIIVALISTNVGLILMLLSGVAHLVLVGIAAWGEA